MHNYLLAVQLHRLVTAQTGGAASELIVVATRDFQELQKEHCFHDYSPSVSYTLETEGAAAVFAALKP